MKSKKKLIKEINKNLAYIHTTLKKKNKKKAKAKRWAKKYPRWSYYDVNPKTGKPIRIFNTKEESMNDLRRICAGAARND